MIKESVKNLLFSNQMEKVNNLEVGVYQTIVKRRYIANVYIDIPKKKGDKKIIVIVIFFFKSSFEQPDRTY